MFFYSMNIPDYRKDTAHLKPLEHYIYRSLIDQYYSDEKAIPNKTQWVMRRLSLDGAEHEKMLENVLNDFFVLVDDEYRHKRVDSDIEKYHENADKNRKNGAKGGRPRKDKPKNNPVGYESDTSGLPAVTQTEPTGKATNNYITNNYETNLKDKEIDVVEKKTTAKSAAKTVQFDSHSYPTPLFVDRELWTAFQEMRDAKKKTATEYACRLLVNKLVKFNEAGLDANTALANSITNGWTDIFEPKPISNQKGLTHAKQYNPRLSAVNNSQQLSPVEAEIQRLRAERGNSNASDGIRTVS